jgi:inner membrane protein
MDSLTHILLGATLGELIAGKKLGKKAMLIGAVAQNLPDIDIVSGLGMDFTNYFLAHRGFTHSFLFVVLAALLLPFIMNAFQSTKMQYLHWAIFFLIQLLTHVLLDSLNAYGVGWFEPFSHIRISFDLLFVADPFYSIWFAIACVALLILKPHARHRIQWVLLSISISVIYIVLAMNNKAIVNEVVSKSLAAQNISANKILVTPTPLNCWLWYVVARTHDGYFIGYRSVFDHDATISFSFVSKNDSLLDPIRNEKDVQHLIRFARGFYTVIKQNDTLTFNNLRFGQINGWNNPNANFVFQFRLQQQSNGLLIIQKGRFSGWNKQMLSDYLKRILGN